MYNTGTILSKLRFRYPHSCKCTQTTQYRSTNPCQIFPLRRPNYINFSPSWHQRLQLFPQSFRSPRKHSSTTTQNDISVQIFSNIQITFHNWLISHFLECWHLESVRCWIEHYLSCSESLVTQGYGLAVWEWVSAIIVISLLIFYLIKKIYILFMRHNRGRHTHVFI